MLAAAVLNHSVRSLLCCDVLSVYSSYRDQIIYFFFELLLCVRTKLHKTYGSRGCGCTVRGCVPRLRFCSDRLLLYLKCGCVALFLF